MCERCEKGGRDLLADPERLQKVVRSVTGEALQLASAITEAAVAKTQELRLDETPGLVAMFAAYQVLSAQIAATWGPATAEIAELVRAELAKFQLVFQVDGARPSPGVQAARGVVLQVRTTDGSTKPETILVEQGGFVQTPPEGKAS